ncbi:MAG: hypothetical protein AB8H80_10285 [Planctomycetota bacterium]
MRYALALLILLACTSCASFEYGELPFLDGWPPAAAAEARAVRIEMAGLPDKFAAGWEKQAIATLEASGRFERVTTDQDIAVDRILRLDIEHQRPGGIVTTRALMVACAMTAGLFPARAAHRFDIHASVLDARGNPLGTAERSVESATWVGWVFLFALPFAGIGMGEMVDDTVRSLVAESAQAGWL